MLALRSKKNGRIEKETERNLARFPWCFLSCARNHQESPLRGGCKSKEALYTGDADKGRHLGSQACRLPVQSM